MKGLVALLFGLGLAGVATAAGFDCGRANTPVERLICQDPELSAQDSQLTREYQELREALQRDADEWSRRQQEQQSWLRHTRNRCTEVACLKSAYLARREEIARTLPRPIVLEAPLGGWRNSSGEEVVYSQVVRYPATTANHEEPSDQRDRYSSQYALIRGRVAAVPKRGDPPLRMVINGVPMPLLVDPDGTFNRPYFFGTGANGVEIRHPNGTDRIRRQFYEAYHERLRPRLRVVLSWDSNDTDLDLHVISPRGEHCFYGGRATPSGGALDVDVTTGYGPEIFAHPAPPPGAYLVYLNYYGGRLQESQPITVATLSIVSEEGTPDEKLQTFTLPMRRPGELLEAARFVYP